MPKKSFKLRSSLTQALDDTVSTATNNAGQLRIEVVPLKKIVLDPENPRDLLLTFEDITSSISGDAKTKKRKQKEKESLGSITKSIKEQGVLNPVIVYKHQDFYQLVAGERRTLGSLIAGRTDIPAKVLTRKPDALKISMLQWVENMEREGLTLWERFVNLEKISKAHSADPNSITATDISGLLGCSLQQGVNYRNLLKSSDLLRSHIKSGEINSIEKAALIAKSPQDIQETLISTCIAGNTLSGMKKILQDGDSTSRRAPSNTSPKVNFGATQSIDAAKIILNSVIKNKELERYTKDLNVLWDDHKSIAAAFRKLLKSLESA